MGGYSRDKENKKMTCFSMAICFSFTFIDVITLGVDSNIKIGVRFKVLGLVLKENIFFILEGLDKYT